MQKVQSRLTLALFFTALVVLAFFGTVALSGFIDFLYRNASGLSTFRNIAQIVAGLAAVGLFVVGFMVALPAALQPAPYLRRLLHAVPLFLLLFTLAGIASALIGIGTVGSLTMINGIGPVTFAEAWITVGSVASVIAVTVAAARTKLSAASLRSAVRAIAVTDVLGVVAAVAMLVSVVIVAISTPSTGGFGSPGGGQFPGGGGQGQGAPFSRGNGQTPTATDEAPSGSPAGQNQGAALNGVGGQAPEATAQAPSGFPASGQGQPQGASVNNPNGQAPASTGEAPSGFPAVGQGQNQTGGNQGGFPGGGQGGQAGFPAGGDFPPGGPGGGSGGASTFEIGGVLMAIFAVIAVVGEVGGFTALRQLPATGSDTRSLRVNYSREVGSAILAVVGLGIIVFGVIQLVQVPHTNPPVQTPITWDSQQTQNLVTRACMNCHSNETIWSFYSYIAPSSWLTSLHVTNGRQEFDLSDLNSIPTFMRMNLANNMAQQIRMGTMPPADYLILHPEARLTDAEKQELIAGLQKSLPTS